MHFHLPPALPLIYEGIIQIACELLLPQAGEILFQECCCYSKCIFKLIDEYITTRLLFILSGQHAK